MTILGTGGNRLAWTDLPDHVRAAVADLAGAPVVAATNEAGGFSPGLAARVALADGRGLFVKAVTADRNADSVEILATEARILAGLREARFRAPVAVPSLVGSYRADGWIALVITEVAGRQPAIPWRAAELDRIVDAIAVLGECCTPNPLPIPVPAMIERYADPFAGWRTLADGRIRPQDMPAWAMTNLDRLAELESGWTAAADGTSMLHMDLRADNLLLTDDGVAVVDWPYACTGATWVDLLVMLPSVAAQGGDPAYCWRRHARTRNVDPDAVDAVLAATAGYLWASAQLPPPPGLPRLRAFQRGQGVAALAWLRSRVGW